MLPDLKLQKVILNHSAISGLDFSICIFILLGIYTFSYMCRNRHPSTSPDSIALAHREGKEGRSACSLVYNSPLLSSDPSFESDPSNEYSLLRLTHVMNSIFLDPSDEFLTQVVNMESPNKFLASAFTFQNEATK